MINNIKKTFGVLLAVLAMCVAYSLPNKAAAEIIANDCVLKKNIEGRSVGQTINVVINSRTQDNNFFRWIDEFCHARPTSYQISGQINNQMEADFRILYNALIGDSLFQSNKEKFFTTHFILNSEGGNVSSAIRIGRMLRDLQATTWIPINSSCSSSCVFLLVGGVQRYIPGRVGVHRPYFESMDRSRTQQQVSADIRALDEMIVTYLRDMNITPNLLDFMKGVPSTQIRWLSVSDLQTFGLSAPDPVYDELMTAHEAWRYGTTSAVHRQRVVASEQCFGEMRGLSVPPGAYECQRATLYGLSVHEYRRRGQRAGSLCQGMSFPSASWDNCFRDVMIGSRR